MNTRVSELADPHEKTKGQVILDHSNVSIRTHNTPISDI